MIPPHQFFHIHLPLFERDDCTPPTCGELSEHSDSPNPQVVWGGGCMNGSNEGD